MFTYWYNIIHNKVKLAILLVSIALLIGITGYTYFENMSVLDAIYMVVITLSTVGYGEVTELSPNGQVFTIILIVIYLAIFTYFITVVSTYIFDGEFRKNLKKKKMQNAINKLKNHVIVIGYGRNGRRCCEELNKNHVKFVCIESNPETIESIKENQYLFIEGDATLDLTLNAANIKEAKALITTLPVDADNVFVVLTARRLCNQIDITSRASRLSSEEILKSAGTNHVVMPEIIGGHYMATLITKPHVIEFYNLLTDEVDANIQTEGLTYSSLKEKYQDKSISSLAFRERTGVNIIALKDERGKFILNPEPKTLFRKNTTLIALGSKDQLHKMDEIFKING